MFFCTKFLALLLLLKQTNALLAIPSSTGLHRPSTAVSPLFFRYNTISSHRKLEHNNNRSYQRDGRATQQLHSAALDTADHDDDGSELSEAPLSLAMGVGIVTALIGYLYSKCMKTGFNLLWNLIPNALFGGSNSSSTLCKLLHQYPAAYIVLVMTLGGGLVATLSTFYFPKLFSAHDYVHVLSDTSSANKMDQFPKARNHLLPVMVFSLLMSISGFSLGPEAPMVRNQYNIHDMPFSHSHFVSYNEDYFVRP